VIIQFALDFFSAYLNPKISKTSGRSGRNMLNHRVELDVLPAVMNALYWNLAIPRHRVIATVTQGVVTLGGLVDRPYQKSCAEATVRCVSGVTDVRNEIAVQSAQELRQSTLAA
jgi:osmotically-inducible protein OsmY